MRTAEYEKELKNARISEREISVIITNLEILHRKGVRERDLELVIQNIIKDPRFKASFMRDPSSATKVGIINPDSM